MFYNFTLIFSGPARVSSLLAHASFLMALLMLPGVAGAREYAHSSEDDVPLVHGATDLEMLVQFSRLAADGKKKVRVRSLGGKESTAIRIASVIATNAMALEVDGYCTSSCAQYLLAASPRVSLQPNSLMSFHMNSFGLIKGGYINSQFPNFSELSANALAARHLYLNAGKDPDFMLQATNASSLVCFLQKDGKPMGAFALYQLWVPDRQTLRAAGFKIDGEIPENEEKARKLVSRYLRASASLRFGSFSRIESNPALSKCD